MELLTQVHEKNLVRWASDHQEAVILSGDLTGSTEISLFKETYPDRFYSMGLGEQNMLSWAGGMAREGFVPFLHTFAVFMYRRAYDQLAMSVVYPNLKVRIIGFLPGIMTPGGVSHQAIEDVSTLRGLPNLTILDMGDATEIETVLEAIEDVEGPVYIRMLRGQVPRLFNKETPFQLGKVRTLSKGEDLCIISSGICTQEAMQAVELMKEQGVSISHIHVSTLKPFDDPKVIEFIKEAKHGVVTLENHNVVGGLGTCVAEVIAEHAVGKPLYRMGICDRFAHGCSKEYLMREYRIDALALVQRCEEILGCKFMISEDIKEGPNIKSSMVYGKDQLDAL